MTEYVSLKFAANELRASHPPRLRIILLGIPEDVNHTIHEFHVRGFADADNWSLPQPIPNSNEVLSVLTKRSPSRNE